MFRKSSFPTLLLLGLLAGKIVLQYLLINPLYELHRDEYLHLDQAGHPAWGYQSVPPFTSWVSMIIRALGNGMFWVHFFPALFGAITIYIAVQIVKLLNGGLYAEFLICIALIFSVLLRLNMLYQPNSADVLAWTLVFYFVIRYIKTSDYRNIYYLSIAVGIGFLNKYNVVFLLAGLFAGLILSPHRRLLSSKHLYLALLLGLLIASPNIWWQYKNHWPVIGHMSELARTQLVNVNRTDFLKDQLLFFYNSLFLLILALIAFVFYKPFRPYRMILITFIAVIIIFLVLKAKSYYAIGLYPVLLPFGSVYLEHLIASGRKRTMRPIFPVLLIILFIPSINLTFPLKSPEAIAANGTRLKKLGLLRWEDGKDHELPQDFADMLGWKEMTRKAEAAFNTIPEDEQKQTLIVTDNYGEAGAINYYKKASVPAAVCFNNDYLHWFPDLQHIKHYIVVGDISSPEDRAHFKSFRIVDSVRTPYAREKGTMIFILSGPDQKIIDELKQRLLQ